jgi:hypothetical protein
VSTIDEQTTEPQADITVETPSDGRPQLAPFGIDLTPEKKDEILNYLLPELEDAITARSERAEKWKKWRRQREAIPMTTAGEHSMANASRIEPPLTQIHAQTAYAKVKGYYDTGKPYFWQVKSASDDPEDHANAKLLTKYLGLLWNSQMDLNGEKVKRMVCDEATFMGLLVVKVVWDTLEWKFKSDEDGTGVPQTHMMTFHDGPSIVPISQEDVYYPPFWDEIQRMPWIAHELHMPLHEFENKITEGFYDKPEDDKGLDIDVSTWLRESFTDSEQASEKLRGFTPRSPKVIDLMEFHFFWDIDDDGTWEDLIFTVHTPSKTIVRKTYNSIAAREFDAFGFIPRSFMLESRGVGQICENLQDEVSGTHRLRNDGMKLAAIKMLAMRRNVLRENKNTIYQGKVWITDNPAEDMKEIALGEVPPSSLQSENLVWSLTSQAVGVSSPDRGFADPTLGTRDTFRGQELRMQQSQGIMSTIIESTSECWSHVGMLVMFQLVRNVKRVVWNERQLGRLTDEELQRLERILSMPMSEVPRRLKFEIVTTDIEHSYDAKRDTLLKLLELTMQAQPQLVQLSMTVFGPQGMQLKQAAPDAWEQLLEIYVGSVNMLKESFVFADFNDTEDYLQDVSKWDKLIQILRANNAQQIASLDAMRNQVGGMNGGNGGGQAAFAGGANGTAGPLAGGPSGAAPGGVGGPQVQGTNTGAGPGLGGQ